MLASTVNCYFQNWACIAFILSTSVAMVGGIFFFYKQDGSDIKNIVLAIKDQIAAIFMNAVLEEAKLLLQVIDEHLPRSLSQSSAAMVSRSKFDYFCDQIKKLSEDIKENEEFSERERYADIIKISFENILISEANKLVRIIEFSPRLGETLYNSTGIRYGLMGETSLQLDFIAQKSLLIQKLMSRYSRLRTFIMMFWGIAAIFAAVFIFPVFFIDSNTGKWIASFAIGIWGLSAFISLLCLCFFIKYGCKLKQEYQDCKDDPGFIRAFVEWKGKSH